MRDEQNGALKTLQHFLQHFLGRDVQVIARLVQQQEVGALQSQDSQRQAAAFAAAQCADRLEDIVAAEQVLRQVVARLGGVDLPAALQRFDNRVLRAQSLVRLGKIAHPHPVTEVQLAAQRLHLLQQRLQEGGLSGAVGADQRGALAAFQFQLGSAEEQVAGIADLKFGGLQHLLPAVMGDFQAQVEARRAVSRLRQAADNAPGLRHANWAGVIQPGLVPAFAAAQGRHAKMLHNLQVSAQAAQHTHGAGIRTGAHDIALDESQFLLQAGLFFIEHLALPFPALLALAQIGAVVAAVDFHPAAAHLPDRIDHAVQEIAVVADNQHGARPFAQRFFQPFDGLHIQVVGRLIQDQQIGLFQQQTRQQGARLLPAAQMAYGHIPGGFVQSQALQGALDAHFVIIAASMGKGVLQDAILSQQGFIEISAFHRRFHLMQASFLALKMRKNSLHLCHHQVVTRCKGFDGFLSQIAQPPSAGMLHAAGCRLAQPCQDQQQRSFPNAVWPDQADLAILGDTHGNTMKDIKGAKGKRQVGCGQNRHNYLALKTACGVFWPDVIWP